MAPPESPFSFCPHCLASFSDANVAVCPHDGSSVQLWAERGMKWIGRTLGGRYTIERFLDAGGCAEVFEAAQVGGKRRVAVKILVGKVAAAPGIAERFRREAELISLVAHPNIVAIQDYGTLDDGNPFMVMELLEGETLETRLERESITPLTALRLALQICEGLAAAHEREVVHRDIKPANLFLVQGAGCDEPQVKILDLGIAKLVGRATPNDRLTKPGAVFGTPDYMSPEQAIGGEVGPAADVYSVACVLWEMLVGVPPFSGESVVEVLAHHVHSSPEWPIAQAWARAIPAELEGVLLRALAKSPADRHSTILELQAELSRIAGRCRVAAQRATLAPGAPDVTSSSLVIVPPDAGREASRPTMGPGVAGEPTTAAEAAHEPVELAPGVYWIGRRHGTVLECNPYLRVFRRRERQVAILVDPGAPKDLDVVVANVTSIIGSLDALDYVFLNHQDPDVSANTLPILRSSKAARVLCSEDTWRLVQFYGLAKDRFVSTDGLAHGRLDLETGHTLELIPTPFCHFRGAVMLHDPHERVLFTGDLFGGTSDDPSLVASEGSWAGIEMFHQVYMPSNVAIRRAIARIRTLEPQPRIIAPQHGALFMEDQIPWILELLEQLPVGLDLLSDGAASRSGCIAAANEILDALALVSGDASVMELLGRYSADGSFASPFVLDGSREVIDFRIEPAAGLAVLARDVLGRVPVESHTVMDRLIHRVSGRYGVGAPQVPRYSIRPGYQILFDDEPRQGRMSERSRKR